jgi:flagellar biosynthesis/type III secretory pathway protein FliH
MIRTENSQLDARLDSRIAAVIANALGDERAPERPAVSASPESPGAAA